MPRPTPALPTRHTADPARTRVELNELRPDLVGRYDIELPGARAAVLSRLIGSLDREPLPGKADSFHRLPLDECQRVGVQLGPVTVRYPVQAAMPFALPSAGLVVEALGSQVDDPAALVRLLWGEGTLAAEIDNSVANLALARANRPNPQLPVPGDPAGLASTEQHVTDGHPLHPCCRTRSQMSVADVLAYAPEHAPVIRLRRLSVPPQHWYGEAEPVLYAHPWQAVRLLDQYPWLRPDGETGPVRPLMSLRTVAPVNGGPHVKTAVDVQMTSAVRTVSPAAVHNGPRLSTLLQTLTADLPLDILAEIAAGAVIIDGQPDRRLGYLRRQAPVLNADEIVVPLAALSSSPVLLSTVLDPYELMILLGQVLFAPLVRLLDRGVALEAHGQNTLVVLSNGTPRRIVYRDLGGVRVSGKRLRAAGVEVPELHGDLPTDDPQELRTKLAAAALSTVAAELIAALTRSHGADPERLWGIVAAAIRATDTVDVPHLLGEPLPIKATTAMRLAADPLADIWAYLDNPLAAHR